LPHPGKTQFTHTKGEKKTMKYTIAAVFAVVAAVFAAVVAYFDLRYLTGKDLGFTPMKRYATKLAKTLLHTEATTEQEAGVANAA
jgi:hypothetical protein